MRFRSSLVIASVVATTGLGFVGLADSASAYPTPPPGSITLTITVGPVGATFSFHGSGFKPGSRVTVSVDGVVVATLTADQNGNVIGSVFGRSIGTHTLTLTGIAPDGSALVEATKFTVTGAGSGLPFTGAEIGGAAGLGALLLGAGSVTLVSARRRRLATA